LAISALAACSNTLQGEGGDGAGNNGNTSGTNGTGKGGGAGTSSAGASGNSGGGNAGTSGNTGNGGNAGTSGAGPIAGTGPTLRCADQAAITPGRAPLRRLTIPEYNNTVREVIGEMSNPAYNFPSEIAGNGFGNDALFQPVSSLLAQNYNTAAEAIATRVTGTPAALQALLPCSNGATAANAEACVRTFIDGFVPKAYRRPLVTGEADELVALYTAIQGIVDDDTMTTFAQRFASGIAAIIEAVLVAPDFLYKPEFGVADTANPALKRPTNFEMANRLSYLFLASVPDDELKRAAGAGELVTDAGVRAQAERLVATQAAHGIVRYFFDNLLPMSNLNDLARDPMQYPTFSSAIGVLMQQETRAFLDYEVFDPAGSGTWPGILSAPYTFVNQQLAAYYGMAAVTGDNFRRVDVDTSQRRGLLTQGAILTGLTASNHTNPVARGGFIINLMMCRGVALPSDPAILAMVKPPDPGSAPTARERYHNHSESDVCSGCHSQMDPLGFALENFDAVGLYRTMENGVPIDASGEIPDMPGGDFGDCPSGIGCDDKGPDKYATPCNGSCATELANRLATNAEVMACFPVKWLDYAYGQTLNTADPQDTCNREALSAAFAADQYNIQRMMVDITQTDGFLYLGSQE
jgi:hypothetical protein